MDKWEIKYYLTEVSLRSKVPAHKEVISGTKDYAEKWAQNRIKHTNFKYYEITKK